MSKKNKRRRRRREICITFICLLMITLSACTANNRSSGANDTASNRNIPLKNEFSVFDVSMNIAEDEIGYADKKWLVVTNSNGKQLHKLSHGNPFYELIAYDAASHKWWGFDTLTNTFHVFSQAGEFIEVINIQLDEIIAMDMFKVNGDKYLLLAGESNQHEGRIWIYDLESDQFEYYEPNGMVISLLLGEGNTLVSLLSSSNGVYVEWFDLKNLIVLKSLELRTYLAASLGIAPNGDLYYATNRSIYSASDDEHTLVGHLTRNSENIFSELELRIFPTNDGCYTWINGEEQISYISFNSQMDVDQTLVVDASFYVPAAMTNYTATGNTIDFRDRGISSTAQYQTLMLSKDSSIDVYMLRSYSGAEARAIIQKGFYEDLNKSEIISDDATSWFERIFQDSSFDGKLFGYPYGASFQMMSINPNELNKLGIVLPDKQLTWNALLDILEPYCGKKPFPLIVNPTHLTQLVLWQAYNAPQELFVAAAEEALQVIERCKAMGMYDLTPSVYMSSYQFIDNYAMKIDINTLGGNNEHPFISVPSLANSPCGTPIWYDWLLINPYSTRKKQAFDYIEAHVKAHAEGGMQWTAVLSPNKALYPRFTTEWISNYCEIMNNSTAYLVYELENDFIEICQKFTADQITREDALAQMVNKYMIVQSE